VFVYDVGRLITTRDQPGITPLVQYSISNFGQTPAIVENIGAGFHEGSTPFAPKKVDDDHSLVVGPIMPPGDVRGALRELLPEPYIPENLGEVVNVDGRTYPIPKYGSDQDLLFRVIVYYRGPFSDGYKTSATWRFSRSLGYFVEFGGREYNYTE
jgi:hypothetical protein